MTSCGVTNLEHTCMSVASCGIVAVRVQPLKQLHTRIPKFAFDHGEVVQAFMDAYHPPPGRMRASPPAGEGGSSVVARTAAGCGAACRARAAAGSAVAVAAGALRIGRTVR